MAAIGLTANQRIEDLYTDHHGWLKGWLNRRLGNTADAADLAQDAFVRLLARPVRLESRPEARVYLRAMANGMCIDLWRRREVEQAWLAALAAHPEVLEPSAEDRAIVIETLYRVSAMLERLPEKVATAFILSQLHGMRYREIALRLEVSERMVKKYMARAMLHCLLLETESEF
ncbi:MAG: sigma-70 family RNA polymerase sigma factor [Pseudoxanthomonas mexicana]|nr:sigma-70 family RNA polymerase sigma factor [Pseudoxanthomonas mexicana]